MEGRLSRREVVARLVTDRGELLAISGLGAATWDLAAAGDHAANFYLWGAMGGAAALGLGLALAQSERPVLVVTGDGEMLMGLGSLATLAAAAPANLAVVVLDNQRYGETGMQESHTALGADLAAIAAGAGVPEALRVRDATGLEALADRIALRRGLLFAVVEVAPDDPPRVLPEKDAVVLKQRFKAALGD
jgi:thiamine pyrophosphate-dependent acetolactate synthase large subunit-like protein